MKMHIDYKFYSLPAQLAIESTMIYLNDRKVEPAKEEVLIS